ncbi:hypothetical protein FM104_14445 [Microbacterium esteraromaticum]|uniref:DUF4192 family protein n=1 Tax=Microbacterium esteraromaticum TaxID=57043 RepID=A0A1R4KNY6_9MICO|nr:DUF4192 family protein [Microbacterium esteraromaticum]SJN46000.1 hypothetical protein FM104_14445 [Microbacterium esteraromaticum]
MSTVIKATDPAEFLGLVPSLAGFTPRQSLVMLPFHGKRTHGAMRIDLPGTEIEAETFADVALQALLQVSGVDAVAFVVYTDECAVSVPDGTLLPHLAMTEALLDVCVQTGLRLVEALCVTPDGWGDYLTDEARIESLEDIPGPPSLPGIGDVSGDQLAGAALPPSNLVEREQVGRALQELTHVLERHEQGRAHIGAGDNPIALDVAAVILDDLPSFAEALLEMPSDAAPYSCAALLWCLNRPVLRDAILVQWATDLDFGYHALDAQLEFSDRGSGVPDAVGEVFLGRGSRPDIDRLGCALEVVRFAIARAPQPAKVGALTAAGWLAWALGRSSHAGEYVDQALAIDPHHSMASLISTMLSAAMLPEWSLRRP